LCIQDYSRFKEIRDRNLTVCLLLASTVEKSPLVSSGHGSRFDPQLVAKFGLSFNFARSSLTTIALCLSDSGLVEIRARITGS
jgi:hypothetical protein